MNIAEIPTKSKTFLERFSRGDGYIILLIVFVGLSSFGLGRLSLEENTEQTQIDIQNVFPENTLQAGLVEGESIPQIPLSVPAEQGLLVGSRNSDKYHYPWCPGAKRIKEENKVWFSSAEDARTKGYIPAGNCKGLE